MDSFFYCFGQGIKNIGRNRLFSIVSIATMTVCIFLFGIVYFILTNVQLKLLETESDIGATVFFEYGTEEAQILSIKDTVSKVPGVRHVNYISADYAWKRYKDNHPALDGQVFGDDNPLENSASLEVYFDSVDDQADAIKRISGIQGVRAVHDMEDLVDTLKGLNRGLKYGAGVLIALLIAIAGFLISTTVSVGVSVRAREIQIESLIGATDIFIRGPFLVEGIVIGLLGACIPLSILYALYYKLVKLISVKASGIFDTINFVPVGEVFAVLAPLSLCISVGIGFFGSYFTLNRKLRKIRSM